MSNDEIKQLISEQIERYHQENYYACYPAGLVRPWILDAVLVNIVLPLNGNLEALKPKLQDPEPVKETA